MLFQHDAVQTIGVWASLREDDHGLAVSGRISDTAQGRDVRTLAKDGAVTGLSIGFIAQDFDIEPDGVRVLKQIDLHEVSVVTFPMNELARVQSVKAALRCGQTPSRDELTFLLRNAGLSRRATRRLLDHGFAGLTDQHKAAETFDRLTALLEEF
jgi:phage head maturation protease